LKIGFAYPLSFCCPSTPSGTTVNLNDGVVYSSIRVSNYLSTGFDKYNKITLVFTQFIV
jgi:hypothetical protein